jgi:hypothetical protein
MGLLDLLEKSTAHVTKSGNKDDGSRLKWIDMSKKGYTKENGEVIPANRGTIKFIPIVGLDGQDIKYAYDVKNYSYDDPDEERKVWYKVMDPKDYEQELTDDQKALILKLRSLIDHAGALWGFPYVDFKNYALMFGYVLEHTSEDGTELITKENRRMALIILPSKNAAKAITNVLKKIQEYGEPISDEIYEDLFSRNTERENYLTITFAKSEGFGFDVTCSSDSFDRKCVKILTPDELKEGKVTIPEDKIALCTYLSSVFFSGNEEGYDFDEAYATSVCKQIETYLDQESESESLPPLPNKNKKTKSDLDE